MESAGSELLCFNGIDGTTGGYGLPPMTGEALARLVVGEPLPENGPDLRARKLRDDSRPEELERLERELAEKTATLEVARSAGQAKADRVVGLEREVGKLRQELARRRHLGVKEGVDATDLGQAGWGVIFAAEEENAEVREALQELLARREAQAGPRFRLYEGAKGYRPNETKSKFLSNRGADPSGPADPDKLPYYLLIVGSPERIPYSFQYQLDVQYAVGRVWFPRVEQYAQYARNVVEAETRGIGRARRVSFFGVRNADDRATELSTELLVEPLRAQLMKNTSGWEIGAVVGGEATRARLEAMMGGPETPALLFTASHGLELPLGHARQLRHQGALLCGDWPGPREWKGKGEVPEGFYFAGEHLAAEADVAGMMVFSFACFGAGTPQHDEFSRLGGGAAKPIAQAPFVSALPVALLGRPRGALAVVGHVDRAWGCSFASGGTRVKSHTTTFQSALERLMTEQPVGHAVDYFNGRYAELSTELTEELEDEFRQHDPYELAALWTANNDARGYVVFGDPAARLGFEASAVRPVAGPGISVRAPAASVPPRAPEIARPPELGEADWEHTPLAVRRYIDALRSR
jgi:hypothetical protein